MSPKRLAVLRYQRRDAQMRLQADITDAELQELALGLALCLAPERQQDLVAQIGRGLASAPQLARLICAQVGTPQVIDMAQRKAEEERDQ